MPRSFSDSYQPPQKPSTLVHLPPNLLKQKANSYPLKSRPKIKWITDANSTASKSIKELFDKEGFIKEEVLGQGHYSTVLKCYDPKKKCRFVFKKIYSCWFKHSDQDKCKFFTIDIRNGHVSRGEGLGFFPNHRNVLKVWGMVVWDFEAGLYRRRDNIFSMIEMRKKERIAGVLTEYIPGALDLFNFITTVKPLRKSDINHILYQVACGIQAIHRLNCIHRDIKLENVLVNPKTKEAKIIDFGFMYNLKSGQHLRAMTRCGSTPYTAPENHLKQGQTAKGDLWSLGVLMHTACFGRYPFFYCEGNMRKTVQNMLNFVNSGQSIREASSGYIDKKNPLAKSQALWELLSSLLCAEKRRASIDEVLKSPFWELNRPSQINKKHVLRKI